MGERKVILITGASTGLGLAIAQRLLLEQSKRKHHLILTARESSLHRFSDNKIDQNALTWIRALDVTQADQREALVNEANVKLGGVDILINNAGVSYRTCVEHLSEPERLKQMNINYRSPIELARSVLPSMREKRRGKIINISSVSGMMAMPTMAVYSASKFALEGASEALFYEVKPWNINVTLIQPGFIRSDGFEHVRYTELSTMASKNADDPYHAHYHEMESFISKMMRHAWATPESVARVVARVLNSKSPPLRVYETADAFLFSMLRRALPRNFYHWLLYHSLPKVRHWGKPIGSPDKHEP